MGKDRIDEIVNQIVRDLEGQIRNDSIPDLLKEPCFDYFVVAYNTEHIDPYSLRCMIYEKLIKKREKFLDQLIDAWEDWTMAWDNVDKRTFNL